MQFKSLFLITIALLTVPFTVVAQEEKALFKHGSGVRTVAYSPANPSLVASAGDNREIKLWDLRKGTAIRLGSHADTVNSIAFSPDGKFLVSGGDDYVIKLWDIQRKRHIVTREHVTEWTRSQVKAVAFSPNGEIIATGGRHAKLWNAQTHNEIATLKHDEWVWAIDFSTDGKLLATGDDNGHVNIWNLQNRRTVAQLDVDSNAVYAVQFSPNNQIFAGGGYDGKVKLWKVRNWNPYGTLISNGTISAISFSPDSSTLAATGYKSVYLWTVGIGDTIATLTRHTDWVRAATFSPDGNALISSGADGTVRVWDVTPHSTVDQDMVRIIYFVPSNRRTQTDIWRKLNTLIRDVQRFYADQMKINGFGRKTFTFETDENERMLIHRVDGQFTDRYYHTDTGNKIYAEIASQFDLGKHTYLIVADISTELIGEKDKCGVGGGNWYENENLTTRTRGGYAVIPASGNCFDGAYGRTVTAHELGHAFGLEHDFRNDAYVMSYGRTPNRLSKCAARWLDANRFFNTDQTAFNEPTTIQMLTPSAYLPNARNLTLQFAVTDADGIHQAQLLISTTQADPTPGIKLHSCKDLNVQNSTVEFSTPSLTRYQVNDVALQVIDVYGNITRQTYRLRADASLLSSNHADVNRDGKVDVADLVLVASNFGKKISSRVRQNPDVNRDGVVNVVDLLLVASLLRSAPSAPALHIQEMHALSTSGLQAWIRQAKNYNLQTDFSALRPDAIKTGIAVLEQLLIALIPKETALLANYPNPFNPETWIPYQLAKPADVTLYIYTVNGGLVRTLELGHQPAGMYQTRSRAAYWNGKNAMGETVASGVYFYTLSAGDFTATRKMLIWK